MDTNPIFVVSAMTSSLPLNQWVHSYGLPCHQKTQKWGPHPPILVAPVIVTTKQSNIALMK